MPGGLKRALATNKPARDLLGAFDGGNRRALVYRVHDAKKPETRGRRIGVFAALLAEGKTLYP